MTDEIYTVFEYKNVKMKIDLSKNEYVGFEISIKSNGLVKYKEILFSEKSYELNKSTIDKIEQVIENNKEIFNINDKFYGLKDGCFNIFTFSNKNMTKKISVPNIEKQINEIENNVEEENVELKQKKIVLSLFFEIADILREENFDLTLNSFKEI